MSIFQKLMRTYGDANIRMKSTGLCGHIIGTNGNSDQHPNFRWFVQFGKPETHATMYSGVTWKSLGMIDSSDLTSNTKSHWLRAGVQP